MWQAINEGNKLPELNRPILIEGLPGIGNVGKIAIDFMIEELNAKKLYSLFSYTFPHSVFVDENNLVELPSIEIYYKKFGNGRKGTSAKNDLLILTGDVQPIDEVSSYEFCDKVIEIAKKFGVEEVITTGGIGLQEPPAKPKIYITGNNKRIITKYSKGTGVHKELHGVVGPIIGVTGLLIGLGKIRQLDGVALLAETFGHPLYLGVKGANEILNILKKKLGLKLDLSKLSKEIEKLENDTMKRARKNSILTESIKKKNKDEISYIG